MNVSTLVKLVNVAPLILKLVNVAPLLGEVGERGTSSSIGLKAFC